MVGTGGDGTGRGRSHFARFEPYRADASDPPGSPRPRRRVHAAGLLTRRLGGARVSAPLPTMPPRWIPHQQRPFVVNNREARAADAEAAHSRRSL